MKSRLISLLVTIAALGFLGTIKTSSTGQQQKLAELETSKERGTLKWHARVAKAKGDRQVVLSGPLAEYATAVHSLEEALPHFGVIIAQPLAWMTYISAPDEIRTWNKFEILENLSQKPLPKCLTCAYPTKYPEELLPLQSNEILIETYGGTVEIEGVKVSMVDRQLPRFKPSQKYLLFLSTDPSGKVGLLGMGSIGVYKISTGGVIESFEKGRHPFVIDLETRFRNSVELLRAGVSKNRSVGPGTVSTCTI